MNPRKMFIAPWQSVQWENGTLTGRDCHVAEENHLKRLAFFPAPRNDGTRGVVIARRLLNDKVKKNVCCAVAICSMGEWDFNRNRLPRRRRKSSQRLTFFPAPRNDGTRVVVIARRFLNDKVKKNVCC